MAKCHADKGSEARHRPRGGVKEGKRDRLPGATTQVPEEPDGALAKGAKDADRDDDEAHARRQLAVLRAGRVLGDVVVSSKAGPVGVVAGDVGRPGRVKGLDVQEGVRTRTVKTHDDGIRAVAEGGTRTSHKGVEGGAAARTLSIDVPSTKEGIKADDESVDARIMADAGQPDAVAAMGEVAVEGPNLAAAGREHWGAGGANGDVAVTTNGWEEKEIDSQGDRECGRLLGKGEERGASTDGGRDVSARHPPPEGEWPGRSAAVEQASAPRRGGER